MNTHMENPLRFIRYRLANTPYRILEWTTFLDTLGSVEGESVLDVACGDGRLSRALAEVGARKVIGVDIAQAMLDRAELQSRLDVEHDFASRITYRRVSATDPTFTLPEPCDVVTAMYLLHYSRTTDELAEMCRFVGRNLRPGGRFVSYSLNPDCDFRQLPADMENRIGFRYEVVAPPTYALKIGLFSVPIWQWSRAEHEAAMTAAGLVDIAWHPLSVPPERSDLAESLGWYLDNPSCIVLSARRPEEGESPPAAANAAPQAG